MKKLFYLSLVALLSFLFIGCERESDNDTISSVYDLTNVNFTYDSKTGIASYRNRLNREIGNSDVFLVYRLVGSQNNNPVWQILPQTIYNIDTGLSKDGELDYNYDFTKRDLEITASGNYNLSLRNDLITNQAFRVVIVPGFFGRHSNAEGPKSVYEMSYEEVIKKYNINDKNVIKL